MMKLHYTATHEKFHNDSYVQKKSKKKLTIHISSKNSIIFSMQPALVLIFLEIFG